jgi:phosphate uptake regulator
MALYVRRIQKTGGSTMIVSLPQEWVRRTQLKPHDEVYLLDEPGGGLYLWGSKEPARDGGTEAVLRIGPDMDPEDVLRLYISAYIAGFETIRLELGEGGYRQINEVKDMIRRWLVGVEVVGESFRQLETQCLPAHDRLSPLKIVERMAALSASMQRDALYSIESLDEQLALDIAQRDYDVDRFYHFVVRQLNIGISNPRKLSELGISRPQDCLFYIIAAKSVERSADHAISIAGYVTRERRRVPPPRPVLEAGHEASRLFIRSKDALLSLSVSEALATLREIEAFELSLVDASQVLQRRDETHGALNILIQDIRRIAEYGSDVCEVTLNLGAKHQEFSA